jgi:hypothetical protein
MVSQHSPGQAHRPEDMGSAGASRVMPFADLDEVDTVVGISVNQARAEVDVACRDMSMFEHMEPDEIMRRTAGHSARLSYIRVRAMRVEYFKPHWEHVRTRELEPALDQLEHQFTIASRLHSVRELDYRMESGER